MSGEILKSRAGELVVTRKGDGTILKRALDESHWTQVQREYVMLTRMGGAYAPEPISIDPTLTGTLQQDLGDSEPVTDEKEFFWGCCHLLWRLRRAGIRHGDLTGANIIIKNNTPHAIDFQQSHLYSDDAPAKRPKADAFYLWRAAEALSPDTARIVRRWRAIRSVLGGDEENGWDALAGRTMLDIGTHQGEFPCAGAVEDMLVTGIDNDSIRDGIEFGNNTWGHMGGTLRRWDAFDWPNFSCDVALMMASFPYLIEQRGWEAACILLTQVITTSGVLFFECQLRGDGPGPRQLKAPVDVEALLHSCGAESVTEVVTLDVAGRDARRTVWMVK